MRTPTRILWLAGVVAVSFLAGTWYSRHSESPRAGQTSRKVLYYHCPMHPQYVSDKPGDAPCCGMRLEPVYADSPRVAAAALPNEPAMPGTVRISPDKQQLIGIRTAEASRAPAAATLRTVGRVAADETRTYRINAAIDGWIRESRANSTGALVNKDEILASFYSPEFLSAQQAYLFALASLDRFQATGKETPDQIALTKANIQQYVDGLRNLGMGDPQIEELKKTRQLSQEIHIYAPASAFILARNISPGQRFDKGYELYRLADLSRVWVLADLFGREARYARPGQTAKVSLPDQGRVFTARFSNVLPQFDPSSRTLKARLEVDNPGFVLRPDMFVDIEFPVTLPATVSVPVDAVIDSGRKSIVFVDRGNGFFEPRQVQTDWRLGDRVGITWGLEPGERIVVSGNFLLDSESRMRATALEAQADRKPAPGAKDPVCGMDVDAARPAATSRYGGRTYYFCSDHCKRTFDENPAAYVKKEKGEKKQGTGAALKRTPPRARSDAPRTPASRFLHS